MNAGLRHVVLHHEGVAEPHYDLMFETSPGSPLATWRSPTWPIDPTTPLLPLPDHRREYLTYEGPLSNNRGHVRRVHAGQHRICYDAADALEVELENGTRLRLPRSE